jgi:hypothetical protein
MRDDMKMIRQIMGLGSAMNELNVSNICLDFNIHSAKCVIGDGAGHGKSILLEGLIDIQYAPDTADSPWWVFINRDGKPFKSIRTAFETAGRNAKLIDVSPHALRHAFAIRLGMGGTGNRALEGIGAMPASAGSI